jgi:ABC-type lipoprotein export system ATPase subunit
MIICNDLSKVYSDPITEENVIALRGIDIEIKTGEIASIVGPSGAGKTTLIKIFCGLEEPTSGSVLLHGTNLTNLNQREMQDFRFERIGILNQYLANNLIPHLTVKQQILLPMRLRKVALERAKNEAKDIMKSLNISDLANKRVTKISGGEAIRTSIGAIIAKRPNIILADEPTGQLDTENTNDVIDTFKELNKNYGTSILVVTHDLRFRNAFKKSYILRDGRLVGINDDLDRSSLDFLLRPIDAALQSAVDKFQYVRLPKEIVSNTEIGSLAEFSLHPSKKFAIIFNPQRINEGGVHEIIRNSDEYYSEEEIQALNDDGERKVGLDQVDFLFEEEHSLPKKSTPNIIEVKDLSKAFATDGRHQQVLNKLSFGIQSGDFVLIAGKSGAGKTTLINVISGIEPPDSGSIVINGRDVSNLNRAHFSTFRFNNISMISQMNNLYGQYTVADNLIIPKIFSKKRNRLTDDDLHILEDCEISHKTKHYPVELSGGENQRAALAMALSRESPILLADEPTANVDSLIARNIVTLLMEINKYQKTTILMSTHDLSLVRIGFRVIKLEDGKIIDDFRVTKENIKQILEDYFNVEIE